MAQTKVKLISDGVIVQSNLHASHGITTAHIGEGSNLYYTDARSRAAISVSGNALSYNSSTGVITSNFEESPTFTGDITMSKSTSGGLYIKTTSNVEPFIAIQRNSGSNGVAVLRGIDGGHLYIDTGATGAGQATKMVIQAGGNVGIGITGPSYKLQINSGVDGISAGIAGSTYGIRFDNGGTFSSGMSTIHGVDDTLTGSYQPIMINGSDVRFGTSATERMRIDSSGKVGIGTSSLDCKLTVADSGSGGANPSSISSNTVATFRRTGGLSHSANISILAGTSGLSNIFFGDRDDEDVGTILYDHSNNSMRFETNTSEKMRIDSSGNVGIGATSPDRTLDVRGTGMSIYGTGDYTELMLRGQVEGTGTVRNVGSWHWSIRGDIGGDNDDLKLARFVTGSYAGIAMQVQNSTGDIFFGNTVVNPASGFSNQRGFGYDNSTGNLQIAATSGNALTVGRNETSDGAIMILRKESAIKHAFGSTSSYLLGNVGIGTTSPSNILHVSSAGSDTYVRIGNNAGYDAGIYFNTSTDWTIGTDTSNSNAFTIGNGSSVGASPKLTIETDGDVNVGSTSQTQTNLTVIGANSGTNPAATAHMASALTLYNGQASDGSFSGIDFNNGNNSVDARIVGIHTHHTNRYGEIGFLTHDGTSLNQVVRINRLGDVGIGTTSPAEKLEIAGGYLKFSGGDYGLKGSASLTYNPVSDHYFQSNGTEKMRIASNGIVYIMGATPSTNNSLQMQYNSTAGSAEIYAKSTGGNTHFEFYTSNSGSTTEKMRIKNDGNVGIGTTNPSYKLSVNGSFYSDSVTTNTYSDANSPSAAYIGIGPAAHNSGGKFRLGQVTSSSSTNATNVPVVTTYSSGHWGAQPTFFLEFAVTYYRPSYIKYYCSHVVSGTVMDILHGPNGGQISSTPLSVTVTQLCASCHSGQPVYKAVWKWSNNGTYLRAAPFITMFGAPNSRVYTDGDSTESAIDTLYGGSSTPGHGYLLHSINDTQAAGHPRLYTQT